MEKLKEFKELIENIEVSYDYDKTYTELLNTCIDYQNETQDWSFEDIFEDIVDYDLAEERAKYELEEYGLERLRYFLGDTTFYMQDIFRIDAYGNLSNIDKEDLEIVKEEILSRINEKIEG